MQLRSFGAVVMLASFAACTSMENPTAVASADIAGAQLEASARGLKPPPPLGTEETTMQMDVYSGESESEAAGGPSAHSSAFDFEFHGSPSGRYMANTANTQGWVDFVTNDDVIASPNARLQYNEKTGKTHGVGTLTDSNGNVLYLNLVQITFGYFNACIPDNNDGLCAYVEFTYGDNGNGQFSVYLFYDE